MRRLDLAFALIAVVTSNKIAQAQAPVVAHHHATATVVDGKVHPELISDLTAYRLWLVAVSKPPVPTDEQKKRQRIQLARIELQETDQTSLIAILADFNAQYQTLIQNYNANATAELAHGEKPDVASMRLQRDLLVQSVHDRMKATLRSDVWSRVDAHVQREKQRMKINVEGGQQ